MSCVAYVTGARPNFVKLAPVFAAMHNRAPLARHIIVHTGQHYDREMAGVFLQELGFPEPDHLLAVGSGSHGAQTGRALERVEAVLLSERPDLVVVAGDVNSTLAGALAAVKLGIPVAHVESGLRSFDRSMPEEVNRVLTDQISEWLFTHSPEAEQNLLREGVAPERIHYVGNTMIDTLLRVTSLSDDGPLLDRLGLKPDEYVLVTLHRPALVDGPLFESALEALRELSEWLPVVFPVHPRTRARLRSADEWGRVLLIEPLGYVDFLTLERHAHAILTDSGGLQEESTFLRVPCFTLRDNTERPVTVTHGTNRLLGLDVSAISTIPRLTSTVSRFLPAPPLWDGRAGDRIAGTLAAWLEDARFAEVAL
jgi:UDP-N-acetylglucosamine 2-epimerase (non-hydrolysing)